MHETTPSKRRRAGAGAVLLISLALAACSGVGASSLPSINAPTLPPGGASSACLDAPTMAILDQLKATGADTPTILAANKDELVTGLGKLQSSDPAVIAWRDALVTAIQAGKADDVAAQVALVSSGQVTIPPC